MQGRHPHPGNFGGKGVSLPVFDHNYGFHPQPNQRTVGTKALARRLGIHYLTVMKHIKNGNIRSVRYGKLYRIPLEEVERIEREGFVPKEPSDVDA
jgi:excisionase family DNA binding protein